MFKRLYSAVYEDDCHPFNALLLESGNVQVARTTDDLKDSNSALIVWGGQDINPGLYDHPMHPTTYPGGARDRVEWSLVQRAIEKGIAIIGVCRGAQMLCAAAGGWLIQNVHHHGGTHPVTTIDGKTLMVNSIHHQMMAGLEKVDHELVAWREGREGAPYGYRDGKVYEPPAEFKEPEFVYFPKINGYAIQWHPEMMGVSNPATLYILDYILKKEKERDASYATATLDLN